MTYCVVCITYGRTKRALPGNKVCAEHMKAALLALMEEHKRLRPKAKRPAEKRL